MTALGIGIVGTGMIARKMAGAIEAAGNARLVAVCSRTRAKAETFAARRQGIAPVEGLAALLARRHSRLEQYRW